MTKREAFLTYLFSSYSVLIVIEMSASKQETKLGVVLLFILRHLLKLWAITSHKLGQLVNNILQFQIYKKANTLS